MKKYPDLDGEPHGPQNFPSVHYSEELVLRGGLVEQSDLLVDKEGVRNPDLLDVLCSNNKLLQINLSVKSQSEKQIFSTLNVFLFRVLPGICPELPEVHVEGEVHELLREVTDAEDVEGDSHGDWLASVVGADSSVVTNLRKGEIDKMIEYNCRPGKS